MSSKPNLHLEKSKTADAETLEHLMTVLLCQFQNMKFHEDINKYRKAKQSWNRAKKYLQTYIVEIIKQNKTKVERNTKKPKT